MRNPEQQNKTMAEVKIWFREAQNVQRWQKCCLQCIVPDLLALNTHFQHWCEKENYIGTQEKHMKNNTERKTKFQLFQYSQKQSRKI